MEKIIITGGLGNIGSILAHKLIENGFHVIIYDFKDDIESVKDISDQIQIVQKDIRNFEHFRRSLIGVNGIVHLAAVSRVVWGFENPHECIDINIRGTSNVLEAARISVQKPWIIFGSSREVYGEPTDLPCKESDPKFVANIYGATKIAGEDLLKQYHHNYNVSGIALRFSNVYGSKFDQLDRVIPKFMIRASKKLPLVLQGGNQVFDFTHIHDTVNGIIAGINLLTNQASQEKPIFDDFHLVSGKPVSLLELTNKINDLFINTVPIEYGPKRHYDVEKFYGDPSKSEQLLKFKAKIDIEYGLRHLANELHEYLDSTNPLKKS